MGPWSRDVCPEGAPRKVQTVAEKSCGHSLLASSMSVMNTILVKARPFSGGGDSLHPIRFSCVHPLSCKKGTKERMRGNHTVHDTAVRDEEEQGG